MAEIPDMYVVVCDGLHAAVGPYDLSKAIEAAKKLSLVSMDGCHFLPVKLEFTGEVKMEEGKPEKEWRGQYL